MCEDAMRQSWQHGRKTDAFTLTELMVVVGILSVVGGLAFELLSHLSDFWDVATTQADLRSLDQAAVNMMTRDLVNATRKGAGSPPNLVIPPLPGNTSVQFYLPTDLDGNGLIIDGMGNIEWDMITPVQFQYVAAARQVLRVRGATTQVVAQNVQSATFNDQSTDPSLYSDEVRIQLTLQRMTPRQRSVTVSSSTVVKLRN